MNYRRTLGLTAPVMVLVMGLGACTTMGGRERIARTPKTCADQVVQIYFEPDSAEVTKEGRAVIVQAAAGAKACKVSSVDVLGLADAAGTADANLELSKKRAQSVSDALAKAGLPAAEFKLAAAGQTGSLSRDGETRPLRRRADVVLHLSAN